MATCVTCGEKYSDKRRKLGYRTCLSCGETLASIEADRKNQRTAPLFNKGAYQYITDGDALKSLGRKV